MTDQPNPAIVVLNDTESARALTARLGSRDVRTASGGYPLLEALADRPATHILIPAPREELAGLARAARTLAPQAQLIALCAEADEPDPAEDLFDQTCLLPPTRGELNALFTESDTTRPLSLPGLAVRQLIDAAHQIEPLEQALADCVQAHLDSRVHWTDADQLAPAAEPLLKLTGSTPRLLVVDEPIGPAPQLDALLAELQLLAGGLCRLTRRLDSLHRLAITDHLTGAYNRRYFYHLTDHVLQRADQEGFRAAMLLYDIDDFKKYNDRYSHTTGDEILCDIAMLIQEVSREQDIVARIGGDEFAVLFWDSEIRKPGSQPLRDVVDVANRFRQAVESYKFSTLGPQAKGSLTISGGLATFPQDGRTCMDLLKAADQALLATKHEGKNSIRLVGQPT
jgi:diguanylate cyclase (GGDEF)-like protein